MVEQLSGEVQELRDENNRLKGEQGKPNIKGNKPQPTAKVDHSAAWKGRLQSATQSCLRFMSMPQLGYLTVIHIGINNYSVQNISCVEMTDNNSYYKCSFLCTI
jgi:hypothetical protein